MNCPKKLKAIVRKQRDTWDVQDTWGVTGFQLRIDVDEDKANLAGVTNADIATTLNAYYSGHQLTTFTEGDHTVPVYLRLRPEQRGSLVGLRSAFVEGSHGKVPLDSIAQIVTRWEPATIDRRKLNRVIEVQARVEDGVRANDVVNKLMETPEFKKFEAEMPSGFWLELGGELEESEKSQTQLTFCLGMSMLLIVLCLVIQYNGWVKTNYHSGDSPLGTHRCPARFMDYRQPARLHAAIGNLVAVWNRAEHGNYLYRIRRHRRKKTGRTERRHRPRVGNVSIRVSRLPGRCLQTTAVTHLS